MVECSKVNAKLTDKQLKKLKTTDKNKTGTTLIMSLKMFDGNDLPHELWLTTRQKTKPRNALDSNMSTDIKLSKAQISKIIQSGGSIIQFVGSLLSRLAGPLMKVAVPLAALAIWSSCFSHWCRNLKKHGSGTTTLIISNKEMNDKVKIFQAL